MQSDSVQQARSLVGAVPDRIVHVETYVAVPPELAFAYFIRPALLRSWLGAEASVEPMVGGRYELFWAPSTPELDSTIGCRITALAASRLLAFQWRSPARFRDFANAADPLTHVVVCFVPEGEGTRIDLLHSGWRSEARWEEARVWQERAWRGAMAKLADAARIDHAASSAAPPSHNVHS